jgi:hypothetical protein
LGAGWLGYKKFPRSEKILQPQQLATGSCTVANASTVLASSSLLAKE